MYEQLVEQRYGLVSCAIIIVQCRKDVTEEKWNKRRGIHKLSANIGLKSHATFMAG